MSAARACERRRSGGGAGRPCGTRIRSKLATLISLTLILGSLGAVTGATSASAEPVGTTTTFGLGVSDPTDITTGPDGNLWFTNAGNGSIGRITPLGAITFFTDPQFQVPGAITSGPDGNLWFIQSSLSGYGLVARMTPAGVVTTFPLSYGYPDDITSGPDGNLWLTNSGVVGPPSIMRITPAGVITTFTGPNITRPTGITTGPDGAMWFGNGGLPANSSIGRITVDGVATKFTHASLDDPRAIVTGPDGALWFGNLSGYGPNSSIGRITTAGVISSFSSPSLRGPNGIASGPDGNLWFTSNGNSVVGRITPAGVVTPHSTGINAPGGMTLGPDGNLWFVNHGNAPIPQTYASVGRISTSFSLTTFTGTGVSGPSGIAKDAGGAIWFTNEGNNRIGRVPSGGGTVDTFAGAGVDRPRGIAAGPDGNLWFTNFGNNSIGRITPAGVVTNFTGTGISGPAGITPGPDGSLWFTNQSNGSIGRITTAGVVTNFTGAGISGPNGIAPGPDGKLWFTNSGNASIGSITTAGVVSNFTGTGLSVPWSIAPGPDGALWFTNNGNNSIGRVTTAGVVTNFTGTGVNRPRGIAAGPDGNLWFVNGGLFGSNESIGRITPLGAVSRFTPPKASAMPDSIVAGDDGGMWFTNSLANSIGRITAVQPPEAPTAPTNVTATPGNSSATVSWVAPGSDGGSPITGYTVTAAPGGATCSWSSGPLSCTVGGLVNGTSYTFTVTATNAVGTGPASASSPPVTPEAGSFFHPVAPTRILDSRGALGGWNATPLVAGQARALTVTGGTSAVPTDATAVVLNVTVTGGSSGSFLTAYPQGTTAPTASNLNFAAGQTIPNLVTVKVGSNGQVAFANAVGSVHVIADIAGYFDGVTADRYNPITPTRILDSRGPNGGWNAPLAAGAPKLLQVAGGSSPVPATADAVILNVTATGGSTNSFLSAYPAGGSTPNVSNVNFAAGQTIPNLVTVKVGANGSVAFANAAGSVNVIADVAGYFDTATGVLFHPVSPARILDSRGANGGWNGMLAAGAPRNLAVHNAGGVPVTATAVIANTTVTGATANSFATVYPAGTTAPIASNVNFAAGETIPNLVAVKLGANGQLAFANATGATHVIFDVAGYFSAT